MMKKIFSLLIAMTMVLSLAACGQTKTEQAVSSTTAANSGSVQNNDKQTQADGSTTAKAPDTTVNTNTGSNGKTLIVYFSWSTSGNTEKMANYIKEQTNADIIRLQPANPYPTDYGETANQAKVERDDNVRPEIANMPASISEYSQLFVGFPIWWHTAPMIIGTFLDNFDFTGIDVYPFTQSTSMDKEQFNNSMDFVRENAKGATVHDGLFVNATDTDGMKEYLTKNGFGK